MQSSPKQQVDYTRYLHLCWKRRWLIVVPAVILPLAAGYYSMELKDQFRSTTLILVQPQKVPAQFVPTTVTAGIEERLQTISQQIFSRTRLEQIIQEFGLFAEERRTRTPEEIVEKVRSRIDLKVHRNDAFQLSYVDSSPRLAMQVTNKLASLFIEENLKVREQQAIGTSQFLSDEIDRYRERVREREKTIYDFKREHMAEMPEQLAANQSRLSQLQNQLQINSQNVIAAEDRRVQLQQQLADMERRVQQEREAAAVRLSEASAKQGAASGADGAMEARDPVLESLESELTRRRAVLDGLLSSFTEKHPDVVRARADLERLEDRVAVERERVEDERARQQAAAPVASAGGQAGERPLVPEYPPQYEGLRAELSRLGTELNRLVAQEQEIQKAIEQYQARIAATPGRQLQLTQLSEDYDNLKAVLESLINKKLQADLAENLERKQKGEQFQILDPANLPEKPFYPNRLRYLLGGFAGGLSFGVGLIVLLDFLNLGVKSRQELASALDLPVLGVIPEIVTPQDERRRRRWKVGVSGAFAVALLLSVAVVHLQIKPLPEAFQELSSRVRATHWTTLAGRR